MAASSDEEVNWEMVLTGESGSSVLIELQTQEAYDLAITDRRVQAVTGTLEFSLWYGASTGWLGEQPNESFTTFMNRVLTDVLGTVLTSRRIVLDVQET